MPIKPLTSLLYLLLAACAIGQTGAPAVDFLQLTDTHVTALSQAAEPIAAVRKQFANGAAELEKFFATPERMAGAEFVLITGDLIDGFSFAAADGRRVFGQIEAFQRAITASRVPVLLLLGNHDISHYEQGVAGKLAADQSVAGEARAAWIQAVPCFRQGTYYTLERQVGGTKYVILLLENGYSAAGAKGASGFQMAQEQLHWLRRQTERHTGATLILALHVPLGADAGSQAIKDAVGEARNLALILGGHNHRDQIEDLRLGASAPVQVRTAAFGYGPNNCRRIRLHPDRIEVFATGTQDTVVRTISVRREKP